MIGGLGDEVPQKQKLFSYQSTDSSSSCEFHYSKNLSVICITKCEKKFDHRLGGAMAPCGPPLDPPLTTTTQISKVPTMYSILGNMDVIAHFIHINPPMK